MTTYDFNNANALLGNTVKTFTSVNDAVEAYPTMIAGQIGYIIDANSDPVHSWVMTGTGESTGHPGRGWLIPTELLLSGDYGFSLDAGSLTSGAALGDQIVYDVSSSNEPEFWFKFPSPTDGVFRRAGQMSLRFSISTSATMDNGAQLLSFGFRNDVDTWEYYTGLERAAGVWQVHGYRTGPVTTLGIHTFTDAHLTADLSWSDGLVSGNGSTKPTLYSNFGPNEDTGTYPNEVDSYHNTMWTNVSWTGVYKAIMKNAHPGTGGNATITLTHIMVTNHAAYRTAI